jgi:hypothetical protein
MNTDKSGFSTSLLLSCLLLACGPVPPVNSEYSRTGGPVFITDRHGERFDITHAVDRYGMVPSGFEFGIGKNTIPPINHPEMIRSHESDYPSVGARQSTEQIIGASFEGDARGYSIRQIVRHEIVNETIGYTEAAVAY